MDYCLLCCYSLFYLTIYSKVMRITTSAVGQLYLFVRKLQHRQVEIVEIAAKDKLSAIHQHIMVSKDACRSIETYRI